MNNSQNNLNGNNNLGNNLNETNTSQNTFPNNPIPTNNNLGNSLNGANTSQNAFPNNPNPTNNNLGNNFINPNIIQNPQPQPPTNFNKKSPNKLIFILLPLIIIAGIAIATIAINSGKKNATENNEKNEVNNKTNENKNDEKPQNISLNEIKKQKYPNLYQNLPFLPPQSYTISKEINVNPKNDEQIVVDEIEIDAPGSTPRDRHILFRYIGQENEIYNIHLNLSTHTNDMVGLTKITTLDNIDIYGAESNKTRYFFLNVGGYKLKGSVSSYTHEVKNETVVKIVNCFTITSPIERDGIVTSTKEMVKNDGKYTINLENVAITSWNTQKDYTNIKYDINDKSVHLKFSNKTLKDIENEIAKNNKNYSDISQRTLEKIEIDNKEIYIIKKEDKLSNREYYETTCYFLFNNNIVSFSLSVNYLSSNAPSVITKDVIIDLIREQMINIILF